MALKIAIFFNGNKNGYKNGYIIFICSTPVAINYRDHYSSYSDELSY